MVDTISSLRTTIDDRLGELRAVMTDEPIEIVTQNYQRWKDATRGVLTSVVLESVVEGFDSARGRVDQTPGRRPIPPVFLDGAASRAFLTGLKKQLEADPSAVLREPPSEPLPQDLLGDLREVLDLLERRLPHAFRGRPTEERHLQLGFETLLTGASVKYEIDGEAITHGPRTFVADFTFPGLKAALKLKLCDGPGRAQALVAEIHEEAIAYRARYERIVFAVCDLGFITDPGSFSESLASHDGVLVRILTLD